MRSRKFKASERLALSFVERVITTSATTARLVSQHYAVPPDKISVVLPGNDRVPLPQRPAGDVVNLLAVGSIVPRKGYDLLIAALGKIPDLKWRLVIAADPSRSPETARALAAQIASLRLIDRVELAGVVTDERLAELYASADLFVLPSRYEGYGMAYTEAIAHGVPVIGTTAGAIPEAVPAGAGMLVAPDNRRRAYLGVDAAGRASRRARAPHRRRPRRGRDAADLGRCRAAVRASAGSGGMSGFSSEWLTLREPYDLAARNATVLDAMLAAFRGQASIAVVDLACGTGSTFRAISKRLPARQIWRLVDNDLGLLASASALGRPPEVIVAAKAVDLVRDLELALDGPVDLITTSALLDLVSEDWLERLMVEAAARRLPVYAALSYDGRVSFDPAEPLDADIVAAVNRHQHGNKGFGPALGPDAVASAKVIAKRVGYSFVEGVVRLDIRRGRPGDPARGAARVCRCRRRAPRASVGRTSRTGWRGGSSWSPPARRACASVTSTSSRCRCRSAERRGRSRAAPRRRGCARASAP